MTGGVKGGAMTAPKFRGRKIAGGHRPPLQKGTNLIKTVEWTDEGVRMIDQRKLPTVEEYPLFRTYEEVAEAIRVMVVRGAPAIGVAAAMGVALGVRDSKAATIDELRREFNEIVSFIGAT